MLSVCMCVNAFENAHKCIRKYACMHVCLYVCQDYKEMPHRVCKHEQSLAYTYISVMHT